MNSIEAFILVGGRSSRMGRDKASILVDGTSLVDRTIEAIKAALPESRISLVGGSNAEVADNHFDRGAWSGFEAALSNSKSEWTFIMACDYPIMSPDVIRSIVANASSEVDAVAPRQADGKLQPLCALYRTSVCAKMTKAILANDETPPLRIVFEKVRTHVLPFAKFSHIGDAEHLFLNVNTEADLEKAVSLLEARRLSVAK